MKYAMVLNGTVIDVKESEIEPKYPPDFYGNIIFSIPCNEDIEIGMNYNEYTKSFVKSTDQDYRPTQLDRIEGLLFQNVADIENGAIDRYNLELVKEGIL